jgi:diguanylate cyclase (GGDEF)-like protein
MSQAEAVSAYARMGDALASASLCHTTVSALETLLGDAAELLPETRLLILRGYVQLATAGKRGDDELDAAALRMLSTREAEARTAHWCLVRHAIPGPAGAQLIAARPPHVSTSPHDREVVAMLAGAVGLAMRMEAPPADASADAVALPDISAQRRNELLELLLQIQRRISHRAPLQDVLDDVVQGASTLLGDEAASIHLIDVNDPTWLQLVAWTGVDDDWLSAIRRIPMGNGASGRAALEKRLVVLETYRHAADRLDTAVDTGVAAVMAAPVHTDGRTMGSIVVATRDASRRYSMEDRTMLLAFADNVSLALTDAHNLRRVDEALHDAVTGLPTRTLFLDRLDDVLSAGASRLAILFCDLDRFKRVNDSLGHAAGDELLFEVARRLSALLRPCDLAARLGGDEFAVLLDDVDEQRAEAITARIVDAFAEPFTVRGHDVRIGISIGLTTAGPGHRTDGEQLLSAADIAMYRAKRAGGSRLRRFEPTMATTAAAQLALEADLQHALRNGELHLVYQPIFDLEADRVAGLETLLRWTNPYRGPVPPSSFVPLAEECGLIVEIGAWVISAACAAIRAWQQATGRADVDVGVNLSARQFGDPRLVWTIERALDTAGIDPARFVIEITESTVLADVEVAAARLQEVRALGVKVALDDFGTGYSSLSHLRQLPIDVLKIDRGFLPHTDDDRDWALTTTMVQMAADLGMVAVAEGIETELQLRRVLEIGCPDAQGYLLGRPARGDELVDVVQRHLPRSVISPASTMP